MNSFGDMLEMPHALLMLYWTLMWVLGYVDHSLTHSVQVSGKLHVCASVQDLIRSHEVTCDVSITGPAVSALAFAERNGHFLTVQK